MPKIDSNIAKTLMTTFIKVKLKKSQIINIDKYRVAALITEYHCLKILSDLPKNLNIYIKMLKSNIF